LTRPARSWNTAITNVRTAAKLIPIIKAIQERLGDRLCFVFRNFPLVNAHPHAQHAAEAAEAAGVQGKFWRCMTSCLKTRTRFDDETSRNAPRLWVSTAVV